MASPFRIFRAPKLRFTDSRWSWKNNNRKKKNNKHWFAFRANNFLKFPYCQLSPRLSEAGKIRSGDIRWQEFKKTKFHFLRDTFRCSVVDVGFQGFMENKFWLIRAYAWRRYFCRRLARDLKVLKILFCTRLWTLPELIDEGTKP